MSAFTGEVRLLTAEIAIRRQQALRKPLYLRQGDVLLRANRLSSGRISTSC